MLLPDYLTLTFSGSKGCTYKENTEEMVWNNVRLSITKDGTTRVQNLLGGIESMEAHVSNYLDLYNQQGWQTVRVERPEETIQGRGESYWDIKKNVMCTLRRMGDESNKLVFRDNNLLSANADLTPSFLERN